MNSLNAPLVSFIHGVAVRMKRAAIRRDLLARSDHELADIGVSRALLADGVGAWPWRDTPRGGAHAAQSVARAADLRHDTRGGFGLPVGQNLAAAGA